MSMWGIWDTYSCWEARMERSGSCSSWMPVKVKAWLGFTAAKREDLFKFVDFGLKELIPPTETIIDMHAKDPVETVAGSQEEHTGLERVSLKAEL